MAHYTHRSTQEQRHTHCNNCGRPSHCGSDKWEEARHYDCDGGEVYMIKVCHHCVCSECTKNNKIISK